MSQRCILPGEQFPTMRRSIGGPGNVAEILQRPDPDPIHEVKKKREKKKKPSFCSGLEFIDDRRMIENSGEASDTLLRRLGLDADPIHEVKKRRKKKKRHLRNSFCDLFSDETRMLSSSLGVTSLNYMRSRTRNSDSTQEILLCQGPFNVIKRRDKKRKDGIENVTADPMIKECQNEAGFLQQFHILPFDIVTAILSRLPVKSLLRFRCVCKQWRFRIYNHAFIKDQQRQALDRPSILSRILYFKEISIYHFGDDKVENFSLGYKFGDIPTSVLTNAVHGLVCVVSFASGDGDIYLLNPSTREIARLPTNNVYATSGRKLAFSATGFGLAFDVSTGQYKLIRFTKQESLHRCCLEVLTIGFQSWRCVGELPCMMPLGEARFVNGALHWIAGKCTEANGENSRVLTILVFDVKFEKFWWMPIPEYTESYNTSAVSLTVLHGFLCFVKRTTQHRGHIWKIWMLRDYTNQGWAEEEYVIDMSSSKTAPGRVQIMGVSDGKIILQAEKPGAVPLGIYSYDISSKSVEELCAGLSRHSTLFTESLVSPTNIVG